MSSSRRDAVHFHRSLLQLAASCVTNAVFATSEHPDQRLRLNGTVYAVVLGRTHFVPLRGRFRLQLSIQHLLHVEQQRGVRAHAWRAYTIGYAYTFQTADGLEVIGFHWHPEGTGFVTFPHLHVGAAMIAFDAPLRARDFHRAHVPTRELTIEDLITFSVAEFGVEPIRSDWRSVLAEVTQRRDAEA